MFSVLMGRSHAPVKSQKATVIAAHRTRRMSPANLLGAVYTPEFLSDWAAQLLVDELPQDCRGVIVDPACGDGALLSSVHKKTKLKVLGVDCDPKALKIACARLPFASFARQDGLLFLSKVAEGKAIPKIVGFIANPPWGAELQTDIKKLRTSGYQLASGQFDTWDLFVEGVVRAASKNTVGVLILPDALFLPEHTGVRKLLVKQTTILRIARLGEGIFPGVYRGTVVVVFRKTQPKLGALTSCLRLTPAQRSEILEGKTTFTEISKSFSHNIPQSRFFSDPENRFDIDAREDEREKIKLIERGSIVWDDFLESGRGIEISKKGEVYDCPICDEARPPSRGIKMGRLTCMACGHSWLPAEGSSRKLVVPLRASLPKEWRPMIVGEDVGRHSCAPSRMVRLNVSGIGYKPEIQFSKPKLLVRKTGVGIKATVDETGSYTNQVVFHFINKFGTPAWLLDYLEGILCSRVMLAWHLKRQGESEWRSHPYVTQQLIKSFPVPSPFNATDKATVTKLCAAVRKMRSTCETRAEFNNLDMEVERLVARMYKLARRDIEWVLGVLDQAAPLEPISSLRVADIKMIFPS